MEFTMLSVSLPPQPVPLCVSALAILAASTDIVSRRIPNLLIVAGLVSALVAQVALRGAVPGSTIWLAGAATGFALLLPFYLLHGMAAGDVKLLTMLGAWLGAAATVDIAVNTFIIGGVWSLGVALMRGQLGRLTGNVAALLAERAAPRAWQVYRQVRCVNRSDRFRMVSRSPGGLLRRCSRW